MMSLGYLKGRLGEISLYRRSDGGRATRFLSGLRLFGYRILARGMTVWVVYLTSFHPGVAVGRMRICLTCA